MKKRERKRALCSDPELWLNVFGQQTRNLPNDSKGNSWSNREQKLGKVQRDPSRDRRMYQGDGISNVELIPLLNRGVALMAHKMKIS